ncbi:MAG: hypothetical protein AAB215_00345 [Planctomycetota bacterium]
MKHSRIAAVAAVLAFAFMLSACSTCSRTDRVFVAKGYCFNFFFFQFPCDPLLLAEQEIPKGGTIENVNVSSQEMCTILGFINRLIGVGGAQIGGTLRTGEARKPEMSRLDRAFDLLFHYTGSGTDTAISQSFPLIVWPGDPLAVADARAAAAGVRTVTNVQEGPIDWATGPGVMGNVLAILILPFSSAQVGGTR